MQIAFVARPDSVEARTLASELIEFMAKRGHDIVVEQKTAEESKLPQKYRRARFEELTGDFAVVIGGDGTVLYTVSRLKKQIAILGINRGQVGFLTEIEPIDAKEALLRVEKGDYTIEKRMRIKVMVNSKPVGEALNEAAIIGSRGVSLLKLTINIGDVPAERFRADGVIVSTPTGSTGYAMSAGGPIFDPYCEGFLIVPIAPYYLSSRPQVVSIKRKVSIKLDSDKSANLIIDGRENAELAGDDVVSYKVSDDPALFINQGSNFFSKVDNKLKNL